MAATAVAGFAGTIGVTAVHGSPGAAAHDSSSTDTIAVTDGGKVETAAAASTPGEVPVSYGVSTEVQQALLRQGVRVDGAGAPGSATTRPDLNNNTKSEWFAELALVCRTRQYVTVTSAVAGAEQHELIDAAAHLRQWGP